MAHNNNVHGKERVIESVLNVQILHTININIEQADTGKSRSAVHFLPFRPGKATPERYFNRSSAVSPLSEDGARSKSSRVLSRLFSDAFGLRVSIFVARASLGVSCDV